MICDCSFDTKDDFLITEILFLQTKDLHYIRFSDVKFLLSKIFSLQMICDYGCETPAINYGAVNGKPYQVIGRSSDPDP